MSNQPIVIIHIFPELRQKSYNSNHRKLTRKVDWVSSFYLLPLDIGVVYEMILTFDISNHHVRLRGARYFKIHEC